MRVGQILILAAWGGYLIALALPAVDIRLFGDHPHMALRGYHAAVATLTLIPSFFMQPSLRGAWYLLLPLANIVLFLCPLELLVHHKLRRLEAEMTALSVLALFCIILVPIIGDLTFAKQHSGHYLLQAALATLAVGNILLFRTEKKEA